ncbi:hypothetical protein D3C76_1073220 [compost metagenome]
MADPLGVALQDQVGKGPATQVAGTDPLPAITAGQGDAAGLVTQHVWLEMPRHAQVAAPAMGNLHIAKLWEEFAEQILPQLDFAARQVEVMAQLAGKPIAAAGAEDQSVIGRALAIGHLATAFAERLAVTQADLVPGGGRQRFGGHDQALHR